ncbi:DUF1642 domain-containing protein [Streptococcus parasanguinis]|uniref:DUF1642 domain-containing protein n=1 Tax=Streptococcus parasanguinis TaxID=1318 RepID=UPI00066DFEAF|nr:DUF1642 domain-containing protein [Streptococcus parasanguinis]
MNKQELIKHFEEMEYVSIVQMGKKAFIDMIEQLDEPQKVTIPQFVADWYEEHKSDLDYELWDYVSDWEDQKPSEFKEGFNKSDKAFQTLVNMHQFGYTIEKEKRYLVKMKGLREDTSYLNYDSIDAEWYFADAENGPAVGTHCTRKELESAGFGWVFDCESIEFVEVEE